VPNMADKPATANNRPMCLLIGASARASLWRVGTAARLTFVIFDRHE
jgi:hypothetical protein